MATEVKLSKTRPLVENETSCPLRTARVSIARSEAGEREAHRPPKVPKVAMRLIEEIGDASPAPEGPSAAAVSAVKETLRKRAVPGPQSPLNDGLDRDWCEPKGLTDAETQQMARLREKYASHVVGRSVVPDAAGDADENLAAATEARLQAAQARMDAEFLARPAAATATGADHGSASKIRVCEACRGERSIKHEYNHRVMERMCETCDGEGVLTTGENGANGANGADAKSATEDDSSTSPFAPGDGQRRRLAVLHRDAQRLDAQIDRYRCEMRATQLRLDAELEIPSGEEQALAEFAHQLQKHVSRLRERADAKRAEAAALRGSDEDGDQLERDAEELP